MSFQIFLIYSSGGPFVPLSRIVCAILIEGIMGNIPVALFQIWASGSGGDVIWRKHLPTTDENRSQKLILSLWLLRFKNNEPVN